MITSLRSFHLRRIKDINNLEWKMVSVAKMKISIEYNGERLTSVDGIKNNNSRETLNIVNT